MDDSSLYLFKSNFFVLDETFYIEFLYNPFFLVMEHIPIFSFETGVKGPGRPKRKRRQGQCEEGKFLIPKFRRELLLKH